MNHFMLLTRLLGLEISFILKLGFLFITLFPSVEEDTTITNERDAVTGANSNSTEKKASEIEILDSFPENKEIEETTKSPIFTLNTSKTTLVPYQVLNTESTTISTPLETTTKKFKIVRKFNR